MMTGDKLTAAEAEKIGMIYKVFPNEAFTEESEKLAASLAAMPTKALAYTKHALNNTFTNSWEEQLLLEDEYQQKAASTEDYNEGVTSFLEKRVAAFKGK
jgi:2-(1,2-epoxy-1,2-dihydrophenyl)acetyl-CoA isomerase